MKRGFLKMWGWPLLLGMLTAIGLVSALVGDGVWDLISAVGLGSPVLAGAWYSWRHAPTR